MGTVRANWHVGDLELPEIDPLAQMAQLQSDATVIDLSQSTARIRAEIERKAQKEARFADKVGLTCDLKWLPRHVLMGGTASCYGCPAYSEDPEDPKSALCRLGREQEGLVAELRAAQAGDALDAELIAAVQRDLDHCEELAEAQAA